MIFGLDQFIARSLLTFPAWVRGFNSSARRTRSNQNSARSRKNRPSPQLLMRRPPTAASDHHARRAPAYSRPVNSRRVLAEQQESPSPRITPAPKKHEKTARRCSARSAGGEIAAPVEEQICPAFLRKDPDRYHRPRLPGRPNCSLKPGRIFEYRERHPAAARRSRWFNTSANN